MSIYHTLANETLCTALAAYKPRRWWQTLLRALLLHAWKHRRLQE